MIRADAPACRGPDPVIRAPSFSVPRGACDAHAHVIGSPPDYPFVSDRSYTPPEAGPGAYRRMLDSLGCERGVLVQVSVHGTDNRLLVETLRADPARLRGIAVVTPDVSERELTDLSEAGVRGARVNVLFGGGVSLAAMETLASKIAPFGWHLQLLMDARHLPELGPRIERLPVEVVFDHMGHMPVGAGVDHPGFLWLVRLLKEGRAWVKLSGAYRISAGAPFRDTLPFARALIEAAPERCLWGSDWPHVAVSGPMPNTGDLLNLLQLWAPDEATRRRLLVDNPARLYAFP